jgi:hypothetical protein
MKIDRHDNIDPNFKKLYYVQYVNNFIVDIIRSHKDTVRLEMCC